MEQQKIIDAIIMTLTKKNIITKSHRMQAGKAVQFKTSDEDYYNLCLKQLDKKESFINKSLK